MEMDTELMNAYIQKQNRMIGELINKNLMLESQLEVATKKLKEVEERDKIRNWQPPINGKEIMDTLNLAPGKEVGQIKEKIKVLFELWNKKD